MEAMGRAFFDVEEVEETRDEEVKVREVVVFDTEVIYHQDKV